MHGSLREYEDNPILGHGNIERIEKIKAKLEAAERIYDEKEISICKVVKDYYERTYKNVNKYMYKIFPLQEFLYLENCILFYIQDVKICRATR